MLWLPNNFGCLVVWVVLRILSRILTLVSRKLFFLKSLNKQWPRLQRIAVVQQEEQLVLVPFARLLQFRTVLVLLAFLLYSLLKEIDVLELTQANNKFCQFVEHGWRVLSDIEKEVEEFQCQENFGLKFTPLRGEVQFLQRTFKLPSLIYREQYRPN